MSIYGYCPECKAEVISRTRGGFNAKDTCKNGHTYPSRDSINVEKGKEMIKAEIQFYKDKIKLLEEKINNQKFGENQWPKS